MPTFHFTKTTTATPEQFVAALTDFGPGRSEIFPNSDDAHMKVHDRGATSADVTEGSGGVWERLRYDWSDPKHVVLTTTDSNIWGGNSGHSYTLKRNDDGTTTITIDVVRDGKGLKGHLFGAVVGLGGKRVLGKALDTTIKAVEARGTTSSTTAPPAV
jgi:hypothetical protein